MTVSELYRLKKFHKLVTNKSTGTPNEFAESLHISRRQLYNIIEWLEDCGADIKYSRTLGSFYYEKTIPIQIEIHIGNEIHASL
ncbi:HTH domain-containing protein [Segatella bryantii]|uniref:HTH domain-containing protein n=1 Tax=Segatella bryantii TaxID=77095 RepID=UPI0008950E38|nr:HTH domain-containing protein [Segatella bryantii]SEA45848.1 HTH domain-containing protein [Segatella bryantii]